MKVSPLSLNLELVCGKENTMFFRVIFGCSLVISAYGFLFPDDSIRTVTTPVGDIIGSIYDVPIDSTVSYKVQSFRGIPYAEAPAGNLRFKKPVPKAAFKTPFYARKDSFACLQYGIPGFDIPYTQSEDCLRLNVYVPGDGSTQQGGTTPKPVMVWIHGGGFFLGKSYNYDASVLSTFGDVIVVTINYRLAQFGFLSTGDSVLPGNLGLWDQHLAIKWVHNNIQAFGGDINRVTIFGESAGSASVIYQTFYPGNKGLFQRAIAESGSITSPWAYKTPEKNLKHSRNFSLEAGCTQTSSAEYINCLSSKPISALNQLMKRIPYKDIPLPTFDDEFLKDEPENLLSGQTNASEAIDMFLSVDLINGFNGDDGLLDLTQWLLWINKTDTNNFTIPKQAFEQIMVPFYMKYYFDTDVITRAASLEAIQVYTDWSDPDDDLKRLYKLIDLVTDMTFVVTTINTANLHTNSTKSTYVYEFFARPAIARTLPVPKFIDGPNVANHGDDIGYVFGITLRNESESSELAMQYKTTQAVMTLWTNFAKTGNPNTPEDVTRFTGTAWPSYEDQEKYLEIKINMGPESVKSRVRPDIMNLWNVVLPALMEQTGTCN